MQGYSESALLDLETSTPQVHRDSVIFAAQIMASMGWIPGLQISHRHFILVTRSTGSYTPSNLQKDFLMQNEASSFD